MTQDDKLYQAGDNRLRRQLVIPKNILSIPNLFPNFALNFKKIEVIILINYLSYKLNLIYYIFTKILNIIIKA